MYEEAIEFDLLSLNYSLTDVGSRLDLRQLNVLVKGFLTKHGTLTRAVFFGSDRSEWTLTNELLAALVDQLNNLIWGLGGGKGMRPKPIYRPSTMADTQHLGYDPIPINDFDDWWDSR